jgi:hypothetical protein
MTSERWTGSGQIILLWLLDPIKLSSIPPSESTTVLGNLRFASAFPLRTNLDIGCPMKNETRSLTMEFLRHAA